VSHVVAGSRHLPHPNFERDYGAMNYRPSARILLPDRITGQDLRWAVTALARNAPVENRLDRPPALEARCFWREPSFRRASTVFIIKRACRRALARPRNGGDGAALLRRTRRVSPALPVLIDWPLQPMSAELVGGKAEPTRLVERIPLADVNAPVFVPPARLIFAGRHLASIRASRLDLRLHGGDLAFQAWRCPCGAAPSPRLRKGTWPRARARDKLAKFSSRRTAVALGTLPHRIMWVEYL